MKELAQQFGIGLDVDQVKQFAVYEALLLAWNEKMVFYRRGAEEAEVFGVFTTETQRSQRLGGVE